MISRMYIIVLLLLFISCSQSNQEQNLPEDRTIVKPTCTPVPHGKEPCWTLLYPDHSPQYKADHALCYDPYRDRVLLFGGFMNDGFYYEFDGCDWLKKDRPGIFGVKMVFDDARKKAVMYCGYIFYETVFEYDGTTLSTIYTPTIPYYPGRLIDRFQLAYDSRRGKTVMFGGQYEQDGEYYYSDQTWEYDGSDWYLVETQNSPCKRTDMAMAYDTTRNRCVIFGGFDENNHGLDDTWSYNGYDWSIIECDQSPPPTVAGAMVYDHHRDRMVMYGGLDSHNFSKKTWEFDGNNWEETTPAVSPSVRYLPGIAYDSKRKRVIIFAGTSPNYLLKDTWEYYNSATGPIVPRP